MSSRKKRAKQEPKRHIIPFAAIFVVAILVGLVGFTATGAFALVESWLEDLPSLDDIEDYNSDRKTSLYDSSGTVLLGEFYITDRIPVTAEQVSPNVFNATVAVEDERFWEHKGVDYYGMARAAVNDIIGGQTQGASTITQQLIRQTVLQEEANDITLERKVREASLAMDLEKKLSKQDILMMYLNTVNYGGGAWGIQAASQHYYSKNAADLTISEAALLSGIPQSPTYNDPVEYPDNALSRRNIVLDRMYVNGYITEAELEEARASELNLTVRETTTDGIYAAPYFTSYVREVLLGNVPEVNSIPGVSPERVFKGGLTIYTTIDLSIQAYAEEACVNKEATLDYDVEVSLACIDPNTGYIKAMRGGKDFYADQFNTCWQMERQAGSTFKAFALTAAIEQGYSPSTTVSGTSPVSIDMGPGVPPWPVENYQGGNMSSSLTMASATYLSSNTAYARIIKKIGAESLVDVAHRLGIKTDIQPNLSVVLGAEGVNTLEMASAFGTLGVGGVYHEPTPIAKIVDYEGTVIYDHEDYMDGEQAVSPEVAFAVTGVLRGVVTGGTATKANLGWQVSAGKTGTADGYKDSMYVGYTPQLSTAIWIGSRVEPREIQDNIGGDNCCPVWKQFMNNALSGHEAQDFPSASNPPYNAKATFLSAEDMKKREEEEAKKKEEEEAKKKEEERKAAEAATEAAAKAEEDRLKGLDSDKDGVSDWDETQAGTNPNDPASYPGASSAGGTGGISSP